MAGASRVNTDRSEIETPLASLQSPSISFLLLPHFLFLIPSATRICRHRFPSLFPLLPPLPAISNLPKFIIGQFVCFNSIHHRQCRAPPMQQINGICNPPTPYPPPPSGWQPASGSWMSGPIHHINTISTSQSFQVRDIENRMQLDPHRIAMERPQETLTSNLYFKILIINTVRYSGRLIHRSFESSTAGGGRGGVSVPASSAVSSADTRQQQSNKINGETSQFPRLAEYQGRYQFDPPPPPPLPPPPNCLYGRHYH